MKDRETEFDKERLRHAARTAVTARLTSAFGRGDEEIPAAVSRWLANEAEAIAPWSHQQRLAFKKLASALKA